MTTINTLHADAYLIRCTAHIDIPEYNIKVGEVFFLRRVNADLYEIVKDGNTEELPVTETETTTQPVERQMATPVVATPHKQQPLRTATRVTRTKSVKPTKTTSTHRHTLLSLQDNRSLDDKIFGSLKPYAYI
jgi:cell division septation protein DedD